jgi:ATP phosphoribosyltransferase regulatory subunit
VDALVATLPERVAAAARGIPRLVGPAVDGDVLEEAERYVSGAREAVEALENLREILRHLDAHGCLGAVILDLGLIGRHDYYTGAVFEAYAAGLGFTVANGGRYDNLLARFGRDLPATGFAIYLERLLFVLPEAEAEPLLVLVGDGLKGSETAAALRRCGVPVLHLAEDLEPEAAAEHARSVDADWISFPAEDGSIKLAPAKGNAPFEAAKVEEVAEKVLNRKGERA